jgi:sarcosine oxidase
LHQSGELLPPGIGPDRSMANHHDVVIAGLGAMGSATAYHLSRRGVRVCGFDRFSPPHTMGSSHGQSRIIREAYYEDPVYVPMVRRAYELWRELEREAAQPLLLQTGGLNIGRPQSELVAGARASAERYGLEHEVLAAPEICRRFPAFRPEPDMVAVYEPRAGILFPEACVQAHLARARACGAQIHPDEPVLRWQAGAEGVSVRTGRGSYSADQLIVTAGAWAGQLLADLEPALAVERQVAFWFDPKSSPDHFSAANCPVHLWQFDDDRFAYGFPDLGSGVKIACHQTGIAGSPDSLGRDVCADEVEGIRSVLRRFLPDADGAFRSAVACLYTNTPDEHFWIDRHPLHANVLIASPCSGHGFKFASVIGEILADLATRAEASFDLTTFKTRWPLRPAM